MKNYSSPSVDVFVTAFNSSDFIIDALRSIYFQDYEGQIRVVVLDDCSSDDTFSLVTSFLKRYSSQCRIISLYRNEFNLGYLKTFNKMIDYVDSDFICFLDSDDVIDPTKIRKQVEHMLASNLDIVGTGFKRVDRRSKTISVHLFPEDTDEIIERVSNFDVPFCGSSVMISKAVFNSVGGFREYFEGCPGEDLDWILRIIEKYNFSNISEPLYSYRFHTDSLTRRVLLTIKQREILKIIFFLRKQRLESEIGIDALDNNDKNGELHTFIDGVSLIYKADLGYLNRQVSIDYAINGSLYLSLKAFIRSACVSKFELSIVGFSKILIIFLIPNSILLKLKEYFGVHHVSR
jgi:glycosyltransferase involved in cell wall biosynthesis